MKVTVFDGGAGNLHSLTRTIEPLGHSVRCEDSVPRSWVDTDCLVIPGVGAFGHAASRLAPGRLDLRQTLVDGLRCGADKSNADARLSRV